MFSYRLGVKNPILFCKYEPLHRPPQKTLYKALYKTLYKGFFTSNTNALRAITITITITITLLYSYSAIIPKYESIWQGYRLSQAFYVKSKFVNMNSDSERLPDSFFCY